MSEFKIKLKIEKLELEVEGTRDDLPQISQQIGEKIVGLTNPILLEEEPEERQPSVMEQDVSQNGISKKKRSTPKRKTKKNENSKAGSEEVITWKHDPGKYGSPAQAWSTKDKSIWVMYVIKEVDGTDELTAKQIAESFNKNFKQAGTIRSQNIARDLGKEKNNKESLIGENTTNDPATWFLTTKGITKAKDMIAEIRS